MALASSKFTDGDVSITAKAVEISVDLTSSGTYDFLCATTLEEQVNDNIETWYTLCGEGISENAITNSDYTIPWTAKLKKGDLTNQLYEIKNDAQARSNVPVRLDNTLMDVRTEFVGMISIDSVGGASEAIMEISGTIKVYDSTSLTVTKGIPLIPAPPASGTAKNK